jgi:hypothetical protein
VGIINHSSVLQREWGAEMSSLDDLADASTGSDGLLQAKEILKHKLITQGLSSDGAEDLLQGKVPKSPADQLLAKPILELAGPLDMMKIGAANIFGQVGATIGEAVLGYFRIVDWAIGGRLLRGTTLQKQTLWEMVQSGFNQGYKQIKGH